jgi:tRNA U34 5-carboxymethylaminomethyl modifying GTPase MnmE/TrmE
LTALSNRFLIGYLYLLIVATNAMDIRQAIRHLGEITGQVDVEDLLENIFSKFCIGK